jgi:3-hydroxyacyl-CoA dehydrogenase/enoyl-CoA hydratase/3-hydroxybutyryl-CoA epimerase
VIRRIAIVGPGLMGLGIAQVAAAAGVDVVLLGRDAAAARAGVDRLAANVARQAARGRLTAAAAEALLARVQAADDDEVWASCDLAIESLAEERGAKFAVLLRLQAGLPPGTLIASNTSGLPITGLAEALHRPERFLGLHFFSPVERMPLVEVVRGEGTAWATVQEALGFVRQIGQQPIVVRDGPGFFTSRVFAAYLDEAMAMVNEGVAPARIEEAGLALGRPLGPLAVLDEVSLRLNHQQVRQALDDGLPPRFCRVLALPVLERMLACERGGRREGGGFYAHDATGRRLWPGLAALFAPAVQQPSSSYVQQRLRCAEVMEALRCLEEGVLLTADDADTGSLLGLGFPSGAGGVLRWAETEGLASFVDTCTALAQVHGARFQPSPWLVALAAAGQGLARWREPVVTGET